MTITKKELMNEAFDAGLITLGAVSVSFVSKKVFNDSRGISSTPIGIFKLAAAIAGGSMIVQYLQKQKVLPDEPFRKTTTSA